MLYNSGTPSLVGWAHRLVGDVSSAANDQWDDTTEVKPAVNREYLFLRAIARGYGSGSTLKRTYATGVADQMFYEKPSDFVRLEAVEVSGTAANLATASVDAADIIYAKPWTAEKALNAYNTNYLTTVAERCFIQDQHIGIVAPITSAEAGTNSIRILYGASTTELSADTDEPDLPRDFHDLISIRAALTLLAMRGLRNAELVFLSRERELAFRMAMQDEIAMYEDEIATAGTRVQRTPIAAGTIVRSARNRGRNDRYP